MKDTDRTTERLKLKNLKFVRGDNYSTSAAAQEINRIISKINRSGNKKPGGILYLGHKQRYALRQVGRNDPAEVVDDKFFGWPVIWVLKEDYAHLATR